MYRLDKLQKSTGLDLRVFDDAITFKIAPVSYTHLEEALLSAHHVEVLEAGGMVVSCKSFGIMLENLQKKDQSVYIIGKSSTEVEQLETWCKRMQPGLRLSGSVVYDPDMEAAAPVSYTHLDVYKRQHQYTAKRSCFVWQRQQYSTEICGSSCLSAGRDFPETRERFNGTL